MKVKSESEVAQPFPTLRHRMDCSPPGSSIYGIFQARVLEWGAVAFSSSSSEAGRILPVLGIKPMSPPLAGGFLSTVPPAKYSVIVFLKISNIFYLYVLIFFFFFFFLQQTTLPHMLVK